MRLNNGLRNLQVDVPHAHYGECKFFMPDAMRDWVYSLGLQYNLTSQSFWGAGERGESHYSIVGCKPEDASAFKIQFPHCAVHVFHQYKYD